MCPLHLAEKLPVVLGVAAMLAAGSANSQTSPGSPVRTRPAATPTRAQYEALQKQLADQAQTLEALRKAVGEQDARYKELARGLQVQERATALAQRPMQAPQVNASSPPARVAVDTPARTVQIGTAPPTDVDVPLAVAPLFEQRGVLTPRGKAVFEPSLQYGYSSSNRVALVGYTVIPSLLIGLVDVREVKRNSVTAAVSLRYGVTNRFEVEGRLPYVYRSDTAVSREIFTGTATESSFNSSGSGIGDLEVTGRYQLTEGGLNKPYLIGSLRFKSRTGRDPFEVVSDCVTRCVSNTTGTGQPLNLPTGSGFYTLQPGLTWLYPSDPAVFFGSFSYGYNVKRNNVTRQVLNGESEPIGEVRPGSIFGMNVGMGLALNDRSSFSLGVDLNSIGRTKQNGITVPGSVRTQLSTLMLGYSYRYDEKRTINFSVGAGLTRDTPDLTLAVRVPFAL